ncbi:hypothetical protein AB1Y20_004543 [Prymnesium parvum]|uniref:PX domain-containing protein n=1 Tax=Prymnesium parvum TaxID=97485 RepID=A0AB34IX12_PRYPA
MARLPHFRVLTEVNHTVNVETRCARRYFADSHRIVTKYVIDVHWSSTQKHADSASQLAWQVARRYSHFRANHLALQAMFNKLTLPKLPPKRLHTNSTPDPSLVAARMVALDAYLKQLLSIPVLLTFLGAHHGMNPYAFTAPPPAVRSVRDRFRRKSGTQITGVWDSLSLISSVPAEEVRGEEEELESISEPVVLSEARTLIESLGLEERVDDFASKFDELAYASRPDMATGMVQRFLNGLEVAGAVEGGAACFDEALWLLRDELEDRLMRRLHAQTFGVLPEEAEEDARLHDKLASLAHLRPEQIGIPADFADTRFNRWDAARAELLELSSCTTPRRKMACVMRFVLQLKQGLVESKNVKSSRDGEAVAFGADELFPVLVFAVLKANPSRLHSNLMYVQRFRSPMGLKSEAGCYFTHVQANAAAAPTCRLWGYGSKLKADNVLGWSPAGEQRKLDLAEAFELAGWHASPVDTKRGGRDHNLLREAVSTPLLRAVEARLFDVVWLGTPCESFSVLKTDGAQPQLRTRLAPAGVQPMPSAWAAYIAKHNALVGLSVAFARMARSVGATYVVENPADRGASPLLLQARGRWASDVAKIYNRQTRQALLEASSMMYGAGKGRDLEELMPDFVQPA